MDDTMRLLQGIPWCAILFRPPFSIRQLVLQDGSGTGGVAHCPGIFSGGHLHFHIVPHGRCIQSNDGWG
jgi:hypothetical protein